MRLFYCAILAATLALPAQAQDWIMGQPILAPQQYWTLMDDKDFSADAGPSALEAAQMQLLNYDYQPQRSAENLAQYLRDLRAASPATANALEAQFARVDVVAAVRDAMLLAGLDPDNLADAQAVWLLNTWCAAHGDLSQTPPETVQAVARQMRLFAMQRPELLGLDDAAKQKQAEALMVQAALISSSQAQAANDPKATAEVAQIARKTAQTSGLDLDRLILTKAGFVPSDG